MRCGDLPPIVTTLGGIYLGLAVGSEANEGGILLGL